MILYATASLAPPDVATMREVRSFASMGFLQGGVELQSVADVKAYSAHGRNVGPNNPTELQVHEQVGYPHILVSFAYDRECTFFTEKLRYSPPNRLGDSGAFTAWTVGKTIDVDDLIGWCQLQVADHPTFQCISLDVIPGSAGGDKAPTKKQKQEAMVESLANGDAMRAAGLKIMEVFHVYEPISHLDLLLDRRQPGEVLGLGGMVGRSSSLKRAFCDQVFAHVRERAGGWQNIEPLHGLGLSVRSAATSRYPWWSVDSSSWIAPAQYGKGVGRSGKITANDKRTINRDVRHVYLSRVLEGWLRTEKALTEQWQKRGVTFNV